MADQCLEGQNYTCDSKFRRENFNLLVFNIDIDIFFTMTLQEPWL